MVRKSWCLLVSLAALVVVYSCSVKEDRTGCPCFLTLDAGGTEAGSVTVICKSRDIETRSFLYPSEGKTETEIEVPKGAVKVSAYSGDIFSVEQGGCLIIPYGYGSDCIFASAADVDTRADAAYEKIALHKQFARISLEICNDASNWRTEECVLKVRGRTCGFSLDDLCPVEGEFSCTAFPDDNGVFSFLIPRQKDDSLCCWLECFGKKSEPIPLGDILRASGFDWTRRSLGDASLKVNLPSVVLDVSIVEWDRESIEVEI